MFYRFVCSLDEIVYRMKMVDKNCIYFQTDIWEVDDFIIIEYENEMKAFYALNVSIQLAIFNKREIKRTYRGYILDLKSSPINYVRELKKRYTKGAKTMAEIKLEQVREEQEMYSNDDLYNINSWGADLSFRELINMYNDDELLKPELQRKYVWTKAEASRFIDSILLGLPVPSVFLAKEDDETMLIIDGFQRIMTVYDYVNGIFTGDQKVFKLSNTENINTRWRGKAFAELEVEEKRRIRNTTIHAIIFEQKQPRNDSGMFQIFERINTGGRMLKAQEIRNCVYQGKCNSLLFELNKTEEWREILGTASEDARMADLELILRFFAMFDLTNREESKLKQINLAKYLNHYMADKSLAEDSELEDMRKSFVSMVKACQSVYGKGAFRKLKTGSSDFTSKINPAVYDAIAVATAHAINLEKFDETDDYQKKYIELLQDSDFINVTSSRTTNVDNIIKRIKLAAEKIYGVEYEG